MPKPERDTVEEDFLTEDPEISSQKYVLLSFLSPEKILANKDVYFFQQFIKDYNIQWRSTKLEAWLAEQVSAINSKLETLAGTLEKEDLSGAAVSVRKNTMRIDRLVEDFQEHVRKTQKEIAVSDIKDAYEDFLYKNGAQLEDDFFKQNDFHTTIRGIKVRGVFATEAEAQARGKRLQKNDPYMNIYQGHVGKWMAWEPDPNKIEGQEYANEQLNTLMKKYRENEESREAFYTEQKNRRMGAAKVRAKEEQEGSSNAAAPATLTDTPFSGGQTGSSYDAMFSGPADLAIARKMEKKAESEAESNNNNA